MKFNNELNFKTPYKLENANNIKSIRINHNNNFSKKLSLSPNNIIKFSEKNNYKNNKRYSSLISAGYDISNNLLYKYPNNNNTYKRISERDENIFNNERNKINENRNIYEKVKRIRKAEYSDKIRNHLGGIIRGGSNFKNNFRNHINIDIEVDNLKINKSNNNKNEKYSNINYIHTEDNKDNFINISLNKRFNNNNIHNNTKLDLFRLLGESIFKKEEYSNIIRKINGSRLKNQREQKYKNFFNIVLYNCKQRNKEKENKIYPKFINDSFSENKKNENQNIDVTLSDSREKSYNISNNEESKIESKSSSSNSEEIQFENIENNNNEVDEKIESDNNEEVQNIESDINDEDENNSEIIDIDDEINENPVDDKIIENLPIAKLNDINKLSEENNKCTICFDAFNKENNIIYLPCIHFFHEDCIKKWFKKQNFCPICRYQITSEIIS